MNEDVVCLSAATQRRLERIGANVAHARKLVRIPENGKMVTEPFFLFWEALGNASPPDIGVRLATETEVHEYDVSSLAALHSSDVAAALSKIARYKRLCGPKDLNLHKRANELSVSTTWHYASRPAPPRLVDGSLASLLVLLQRGTGLPLAPKRVELMRSRADEAMLLRFFGCPIRFRAPEDAIVFDEKVLSTPFVTHNANLVELLVPGLEERLDESVSFVHEVRAAVGRRMAGEKPSLAKVARELALSARTLQRRLAEGGLSYQQLLDDVRHQAALRLLRSKTVEVSEIAFLLGFEEFNSFTRAFRSWEGTTPNRWRDSMEVWRDPIGQTRSSLAR